MSTQQEGAVMKYKSFSRPQGRRWTKIKPDEEPIELNPFAGWDDEDENDNDKTKPNSKPLEEFTCFPDLPIDVRVIIWHLAATTPRIAALHQSHLWSDDKTEVLQVTQRDFNVLPAILSVSSEARTEALRVYTLTFGAQTVRGGSSISQSIDGPGLYVNFAKDTVYLSSVEWECPGFADILKYDFFLQKGILKSIAVDLNGIDIPLFHWYCLLHRYRSIEEVIFVLRAPPAEDYGNEGELKFIGLSTDEVNMWYEGVVADFIELCYNPPEAWLAQAKIIGARQIVKMGREFTVPRTRIVGMSRGGIRI